MAKRADIAKRRWLSVANVYARQYFRTGNSPSVAAHDAMHRTLNEAEHGGMGIGRSTTRRAILNWQAWTDEVLRRLATDIIAEGC
jgi:hypothetical protein